jgi:hypothetical protein
MVSLIQKATHGAPADVSRGSLFVVANPFGASRSWRKCWFIALTYEAIVALAFTTAGVGADNPLTFYLAFALQLPASIIFEPLVGWAKNFGWSEDSSLVFACVSVAFIELILIALLLRAPWRKSGVPPRAV